jgi:hypothetical protein
MAHAGSASARRSVTFSSFSLIALITVVTGAPS